MCVYDSCIFPCISKSEHNSKYAKMRRFRSEPKDEKDPIPTKSWKVNWNIVEKIKGVVKNIENVEY